MRLRSPRWEQGTATALIQTLLAAARYVINLNHSVSAHHLWRVLGLRNCRTVEAISVAAVVVQREVPGWATRTDAIIALDNEALQTVQEEVRLRLPIPHPGHNARISQ